ncbi:MAG: BON domain-containing protein [Gammaproteobacteria bacterium]|nr:BON domain-containing protein [Gammaproteobacteria bacterium]
MELNIGTLAAGSAAAVLSAVLMTATAQAAPEDPAASPATTINQSDASRQSPSDARTAQEIDKQLKADPKHFFRHVNVTVHDGVARLGGFVDTQDALAKAKQIASATPGVTRVDSEMKVQRNGDNANQPD